MNKISILAAIASIGFSLACIAQNNDKSQEFHTVSGYRHGISFFPKVQLQHVEYSSGEELSFDKFHSLEVIAHWLEKWSKEYPGLTDLYVVEKSFEGRDILQMTITNKSTGKHTDKPAAYFEGNRHSGEVTSAESVMWLIQHLLEGYGNDPKITELLDTKTIYVRPVNNPDGHELYMNSAQSNRSTVRPTDNDLDGLIDEDSPDDIDGDGLILTMRWKDSEKGNLIPDPDDPTGRIMKRVKEGEGIYRSSQEGLDNDGDGRINEDGIGGLDLHRNYPENWRPERHVEQTGRGFTQTGAGDYPLSETETRSVVTFLLSHPNISVVNSMDTRVPMHLRPPSTSASEERMYPSDLEWYKHFDKLGKNITGYTRAGDVYNDYGGGSPLFGHGPDFGYWYYGSIWYGDELWNGASYKDYDGDGDIDQLDQLRWDDEENDGLGFIEWKSAVHPVYGEIEIGGFDPKFFSQNAPSKHLLPWAENQALFNLEMAYHLPQISWDKIEVKRVKSYKNDSTDYLIKVIFKNSGKLPTALEQANLVKIVKEDEVTIKLTAEGREGKPHFKSLEKPSNQRRRNYYSDDDEQATAAPMVKSVGHTQGGASTSAEFRIRVYGDASLKGVATVSSTRGGVLRDKEFVVGK